MNRAGSEIPDKLAVGVPTLVHMLEEETHPSCSGEPRGRVGKVLADLRAGRPLVIAGVLTDAVHAILAERE